MPREDDSILEDKQVLVKGPADENPSYYNGVPNLCHPAHIGLMITYAGVGIFHGAFPRTVYPYFRMYLNMDGYQVAACSSIIDMAWSFKVFFGLLCDSVPVWGLRRRFYVFFGWLICLLFLIAMAAQPTEVPYFAKGQILGIPDARLRHVTNPHAPSDGTKYILMMMMASMGYVMSDVACDAAMVELAQTEREDVRGHTQIWSYIIKNVFSSISTGFVGFSLNGAEYGGAFSWSITFNVLMWLLCFVVIAVLPAVMYFPDEMPSTVSSFRVKCKEMYDICTQRAIWQTMWFQFSNAFFTDFIATPSSVIASEWARVEPINDSVFISIVVVDAIVSFLTIYDVVRNQWFFLGAPVLNQLPQGVRYVVTGFVIVEVADAGHEGATYGLVMTVGNLASPLAASMSKLIDGRFQAYQSDIVKDTKQVRDQVAYTYVIMYGMRLFSIVTLVLLPAQKRQAQALKRNGGQNRRIGTLTLFLMADALLFGVVSNLLTIIPSTSCLRIAGGQGCGNSSVLGI